MHAAQSINWIKHVNSECKEKTAKHFAQSTLMLLQVDMTMLMQQVMIKGLLLTPYYFL